MGKLLFIWEHNMYTTLIPSVPFLLHLFFLQVHQTNIPVTASAATDPLTLHQQHYLWYLQCVISFRNIFSNDLRMKSLPLYSSYGQETFGIQSELNLFSSHNLVFHNSLHNYIELNRLQCIIMYFFRKRWGIQILFMQG